MVEDFSRTVSRRTIAKGAAWSLPVLAIATSAASAAVSGAPTCNDCSVPLVGGGASTAVVTNNRGTLLIAGAFTALATACTGLVTAGVATTHKATLTMSDGKVYTTTLNLGVGPMAAGIIALGSGIAFTGVTFPDGIYASAAGVGNLPVRPTKICFDVDIPLQILGGPITQCSQQVCFTPSFLNPNLGRVGAVTHDGSVTFGTVWK